MVGKGMTGLIDSDLKDPDSFHLFALPICDDFVFYLVEDSCSCFGLCIQKQGCPEADQDQGNIFPRGPQIGFPSSFIVQSLVTCPNLKQSCAKEIEEDKLPPKERDPWKNTQSSPEKVQARKPNQGSIRMEVRGKEAGWTTSSIQCRSSQHRIGINDVLECWL